MRGGGGSGGRVGREREAEGCSPECLRETQVLLEGEGGGREGGGVRDRGGLHRARGKISASCTSIQQRDGRLGTAAGGKSSPARTSTSSSSTVCSRACISDQQAELWGGMGDVGGGGGGGSPSRGGGGLLLQQGARIMSGSYHHLSSR